MIAQRLGLRRLGLVIAAIAAVVLAVACGEDEEPPTSTATSMPATVAASKATAASTSAPATTTAAAKATGTTPATPATTRVRGLAPADVDGLTCTGQWKNETFGSTGAFAATFEVGGQGGEIVLDLGGNVFGGQGGTVRAPFAVQGNSVVITGPLGFLGSADVRVDDSTATGTLTAPPALGPNSKVTVADLQFDGKKLTMAVDIDFGTGARMAKSTVSSDCKKA